MHVLEQSPASQIRHTAAVHAHEAALQHLAWRILGDRGQAEEVTQDSLFKLATDPVLARPDAEVAAWLRRVTVNGAFNRLRTEQRARRRTERAGQLAPAAHAEDETVAAVLASEERRLVRQTLMELPERQRTILLLRASGCSYAEVAAAAEVAAGSVGTLLARAERAFRRRYETLKNRSGDAR